MTRYLRIVALMLFSGSLVFAQGGGTTTNNYAHALNGTIDVTTTLPGGSQTTQSLDVSIATNESRTFSATGDIVSGEATVSASIGDQTYRGGSISNANGEHTIYYVIRWTVDGVTYQADLMVGHNGGTIGGARVVSHNTYGTATFM